ncbi:Uncharacterised protein [Staphylococcus xylosus]|nr:Uncharacterised protein [Staphylococcus xylosus]
MEAVYLKPIRLKNYLRHEKPLLSGVVYHFLIQYVQRQ